MFEYTKQSYHFITIYKHKYELILKIHFVHTKKKKQTSPPHRQLCAHEGCLHGSALCSSPCQPCWAQPGAAALALRAAGAQTLVPQTPESPVDNGQAVQGMALIFILYTDHIYPHSRATACKTNIALTAGFKEKIDRGEYLSVCLNVSRVL